MDWTLVQSKDVTATTGGTTSVATFTSNTTTGNTIIAVCLPGTPLATISVSGVAINPGSGTFTKLVSQVGTSSVPPSEIWAAANITGGTTPTVTVTYNVTPGTYSLTIYEFSGGLTTLLSDGTHSTAATTSTALTTGAVVTTTAGDLVVKGFNVNGAATVGGKQAGWTEFTPSANTDAIGFIVQSAAGSITGTGTQTPSSLYTGVIATLKSASGPTILNVTVSIAGVATSLSFTGNVLILKNGDVNIVGDAAITGTATWRRNAGVSFAVRAVGTFKALDVEDRIVNISGTATGTFLLVQRKAGTVNIAGHAAMTPFAVFGPQNRITIIGRATIATVFKGRTVRDQIAPITPSAAFVPNPFVINNADVNIVGAADLDPPALTAPTSISGDVHIFGLATGSLVVPFEAQAIARFFSTLAAPAQVTVNGRASFAPVPQVAKRATRSFAGKAVTSFAATVTGVGTVSGTVIFHGSGAFVPQGVTTHRAQVQIHAGNLLAQTRNATVNIRGRAALVASVKQTQDAVVAIQGSAVATFSALVTGPTIISAQFSGTGRAVATLVTRINQRSTVSITGRAVARFASSSTVLTNVNAAVSIRATADGAKTAFVSHRGTVSFAGTSLGIFTPFIQGSTVVNGKTFTAGRAVLTLSPKVTRSSTLSVAARATGVFTSSSTVLTNVNGDINIQGRATLAFGVKVTRSNTVSIAGRAAGVFLGSIQGPNLLNAAIIIRGRANLRPQLLGIPVTSGVNLSGRSALVATSFITVRIPAAISLRGRGTANFLAFTQGTTNLNAVLGIQARGFILSNAFIGSAPVVNFSARATPNFRPSQTQRASVGIAGFATFTPQTPHQALVWISANNLQYKVWQFNLEQMVRVLGTTFTVTSVGLSFQSVALELSSSDAGWGS